ncbi:hypothetical protein SAICODRAFT_9443 [Saitoella complicata NRRL Y-17804]|nr:uncharacterized protein SAICODRAFT_9443 [Saitoella complicata NRRL Y-17804]ODQ50792.1 hypothetical protein SAICODRAFT_9443 [Saitoella complicata NRRL Y-17804]
MSWEASKAPARTPSPEPESIFEDALTTIFNDVQLSHGEPGKDFIYHHPQYGDIKLRLSSPSWDHIPLFAHFLWSSSLLLTHLLASTTYSFHNQSVLELGAGTGLVGICAVRGGARWVTVSDYPSDQIMEALRWNVGTQVRESERDRVCVQPHTWGEEPFPLIPEEEGDGRRYDWVVACDTLWIPSQHTNLISTITHTLSHTPHARLLLIAGFHTGRANVAGFFDLLSQAGFVERDRGIRERMVTEEGIERDWRGVRGEWEEDLVERKRWVVVAEMGWGEGKLGEFARAG